MWWDSKEGMNFFQWGFVSRPRYHGRMSRRARHQRGRDLAHHLAEGLPLGHDQSRYGTGPFGRVTLFPWSDIWRRRR